MTTKFALGQVVATPDALDALRRAGQRPAELLDRHSQADWGDDLCNEDRRLNDEAIVDGSRILSSYILKSGQKLWIITEACGDDDKRASTCMLLPENY